MATNENKRNLNSPDAKGSPAKKRRELEICSFKERCYRKNPHHFMEYDHPHLDILVDLNEEELNLNIPDTYLEKAVVIEQIKILKDVKKPAKEVWKNFHDEPSTSSTNSNTRTNTNARTSTNSRTSTSSSSNSRTSISSSSNSKTATSQFSTTFATKLSCNSPYNLFFTVIPDSPQTKNQNNSIQFTDLLCPSLGTLKSSLQMNFMIDIMWLMEKYAETNNEKKPMTMLFGEDFPNMRNYMDRFLPQIKYHLVKMQDPFGTHHSKMGIYAYEDGSIRVVISTANLYAEDWSDYCQGVWVSPQLPLLSADKNETDGSGPTDFKGSLISYLKHYKLPILEEWIERVKRADFSAVKVFFLCSVPGKHPPKSANCHLQRVGDLLSRHCTIPEPSSQGILSWSVIAQSSSLGNYGANAASWLRSALLRSLASHTKQPLPANSNVKFNMVFPSEQNVLNSYKGRDGGGCLPYGKKAHEKQKWLETYLHQWKADRSSRTRAMPHIKSYCRVSPDNSRLAYFILTSANISKAAWGTLNKSDSSSYLRSYEVGVMFLPKFFDEPYFTIDAKRITTGNLFPFIYDLPLTPYQPGEAPWTQ